MHRTTNHFTDGHCTECGECCGRFLPLCQSDIKRIRKYLRKHTVELPRVIGGDSLARCPFLDKEKKIHRCTIYEARPNICRVFSCKKMIGRRAAETIVHSEPYDMIEVAENLERTNRYDK